MGKQQSTYESLATRIEQFHGEVIAYNNRVEARGKELRLLIANLKDWTFTNPFDKLESEINDLIGNWNVDKPLQPLQDKLSGYHEVIDRIDRQINRLKDKQQKLLQLPERNNRKIATNQIAAFLKVVPNISLDQLDKVNTEVIPELNKLADDVLKAFADEEDKIKRNQKLARNLKQKVSKCDDYVDRFKLRQWCGVATNVANQVLREPNVANPQSDEEKLREAERFIDRCLRQFEEEQRDFDRLLETLLDTSNLLWSEDYDGLREDIRLGAYRSPAPIAMLQSRYDSLKPVKRRDIDILVSAYSETVRKMVSDEISNILNISCSRNELNKLKKKLDAAKSQATKELIMKILKILGYICLGILSIFLLPFYLIYKVIKWWADS